MKNFKRLALALMVGGVCATASAQDFQEYQEFQRELVKKNNQKRNVDVSLGLGVNGGWVTSKVYTPIGEYSWKGSQGYTGELNCVFANGFGIGVDYQHSEASYPIGYGNTESELKLDYVLPYLIYGGSVGGNWLLKAMFGIGYGHYSDAGEGQGGFAMKTAATVEYLLNKHLGLALEVESRSSYYSEPEGFSNYKKNNESFGYSRLSFNLGLMVHI